MGTGRALEAGDDELVVERRLRYMKRMSAPDHRTRLQRHRDTMRARGMRPVQIWIPDSRTASFQAEARRQCLAANHAEDEAEMDWLERVSLFDDPAAG